MVWFCALSGQGADMPRFLRAAALAASLLFSFSPMAAKADENLDFDVSGGHFFIQTNQSTIGAKAGGYSISDLNGIPFWSYFNDSGGQSFLGYPDPRRFPRVGYDCQATQ